MTRARELADLLTGGQTIATDDNTTQLTLKSTDTDSSVGPVLDLVRDSASPADGDGVGIMKYIADNDAGEATTYSQAFTTLRDASDGAEDGQVINSVITNGSLVDHLRMGRGSANGQSEVVINEGSADIDFRVEGNGNANAFFVQGSDDFIGIGTGTPKKKLHILDTTSDGVIILDRNDTSTDHQICFAHNYQSGGQSGGNYYAIGVDDSENKLVFAFDANSQASLSADAKMTMNSSGVLSVPNGIELGLSFDAAASNTLDDYEEGTYTPVLASTSATFSYSVQQGTYVKIGQLVYLQFNITLNANPSGTTSNVVFLDNIPFNTHDVHDSLYGGGHIGHYFNINLSAGTTMVYQTPIATTNQLELKEVGDNIGENSIVASELQNGSVIRGSVMYRSA